jgi:type I restriction enzyme M protein
MLHGLDSDSHASGIRYGDTLSPEGQALPKATLVLTNPPFGTKKGGGLPSRDDFTFPTSNKQFCFLQHIYRALLPGGRAGVIMPDNVLFEGNTGKQIRADLMDKCNLHTILRLPTGIFYAQGVKTNVLFFTRGETDKGNTEEVWVFDLRANMPQFGKRTVLTRQHFAEFEAAFGDDSFGGAKSSRSVRTRARPVISAALPASGSLNVATASTSPSSRMRAGPAHYVNPVDST